MSGTPQTSLTSVISLGNSNNLFYSIMRFFVCTKIRIVLNFAVVIHHLVGGKEIFIELNPRLVSSFDFLLLFHPSVIFFDRHLSKPFALHNINKNMVFIEIALHTGSKRICNIADGVSGQRRININDTVTNVHHIIKVGVSVNICSNILSGFIFRVSGVCGVQNCVLKTFSIPRSVLFICFLPIHINILVSQKADVVAN